MHQKSELMGTQLTRFMKNSQDLVRNAKKLLDFSVSNSSFLFSNELQVSGGIE